MCGECLLVLQRVLRVTLVLLLGVSQLSGCADVRKVLGYEKTVPDEFRLMARVPLEMPETFDLVALATVMTRRQLEHAPENQVARLLTGYPQKKLNNELIPLIRAFLQMAGAHSGWSDIRAVVDHEALTMLLERRRLIDHVMFWRESLTEGGPKVKILKEILLLQEIER